MCCGQITVGFGIFSITERASHEVRNSATGKTMTIHAKKFVKFKPGKTLADAAASVKPARKSQIAKSKAAK